MKFSLNDIFLERLASFQPNWHRYTFGTILSLMYICDLDPIINFIILYVAYPLNEQMEFLQVLHARLPIQGSQDRSPASPVFRMRL